MLVPGPMFTITGLNLSQGFSAAQLVPTTGAFIGKSMGKAYIQTRSQACYFNMSGETATSDHLSLFVGQSITVGGPGNAGVLECQKFRAIEAAASATLIVQPFYRT